MSDLQNPRPGSALPFSLRSLLVLAGLVAFAVGTYVPLASALQRSKREAARLRADVYELKAQLELSGQKLSQKQYELERARTELASLKELLAGHGYAGRGTFFLMPEPIRP
jgi:hypothetical protein